MSWVPGDVVDLFLWQVPVVKVNLCQTADNDKKYDGDVDSGKDFVHDRELFSTRCQQQRENDNERAGEEVRIFLTGELYIQA